MLRFFLFVMMNNAMVMDYMAFVMNHMPAMLDRVVLRLLSHRHARYSDEDDD